jgi:hypothetical protein
MPFLLSLNTRKRGLIKEEMRRYILITYEDDGDIRTIATNHIAEELGLIVPNGKLIILRINGIDIGLYRLIEDHAKE